MTAKKIDTTKYNAMVANASPNVKISSTVFKNFIGDVRSVVDQHADEVNGKVSKSGDTMTGNLAFSGIINRGIDFRGGDASTIADLVNFPEVSTQDANIRLFRHTNTSGDKSFALTPGDGSAANAFRIVNGAINVLNRVNVTITAGSGSPEGSVTAPVGSIYLRTNGGAGSTFYVKESGSGNTGWVAK